MEGVQANGRGSGEDTVEHSNLVYLLESAVVDWGHQVDNVLKTDSAQPLIDGMNSGPLVELDFWASKMANLSFICEQLQSEDVDKIRRTLTEAKSSYAPVLEKTVNDVQAALEECMDITLYLEPLRSYFEEVEETEYGKLATSYECILKLVKMVYANSLDIYSPGLLSLSLK